MSEELQDLLREVDGMSLLGLLQRNAVEHADDPALSWNAGASWSTLTWSQYRDEVHRVAGGLAARGVQAADHVAIMAANRPEHVIADLAVLMLGAVPVSVYPTLAAEQLTHVVQRSSPRLVLLDAAELRTRWLDAGTREEDLISIAEDWSGLIGPPAPVSTSPLATVIYTSGTTGEPKAVPLTEHNVLFMVHSLARVSSFEPGYVNLSYLPLAHIAERLFSHYIGLLRHGHTFFCADQAELPATLRVARPQAFLGVPRVWEKLRAAVSPALADGVTDELAANVRTMLGLDRASFCCSGAAPMPVDVLEFWDGLGLPIHEAYGLTEATGVLAMSRPGSTVYGTVGPAVPGVQLRLADDGEICARGPNVMAGYLGGEQVEDWLATGDLGSLDEAGRLRIIGRTKELIVTAGGKNVAPAPIEAMLKEDPLIAQACVVGDRRPYLTALIVADPALAAELDPAQLSRRVQAMVDAANARVSRAEQIKRFMLLERDWTPETGELTPTLKLRRTEIHRLHAESIEELYA